MGSLTEKIEKYIRSLLESNSTDEIILRRKELASVFGCVPSQINYVLQSRFTPERDLSSRVKGEAMDIYASSEFASPMWKIG